MVRNEYNSSTLSMKHYVLVTGASSGIGLASCDHLLKEGYYVIGGVRTIIDAERLTSTFGHKFYAVILDVTNTQSVAEAKVKVSSLLNKDHLVAIVNNAGIVISGTVLHVPIEEWKRQFDVNVFGLIDTTQKFFDYLIKSSKSTDPHPVRIINMSSVSGRFASPFMGPYAASKYALEALSDSLRRELYMYDIQVVLIEPGSIATPLWDKAKAAVQYVGPEHEWMLPFKNNIIDHNVASGLHVDEVARCVVKTVKDKNVKSRYLIKSQSWKFRLVTMLPTAWVDRMILKKLRSKSNIRPF